MVVRVGGDEEHAFQGKRAIAERDILGKPRTRGQRRRGNSKAEGWSVFRSPTTPGGIFDESHAAVGTTIGSTRRELVNG
jgi:hypothetical protein